MNEEINIKNFMKRDSFVKVELEYQGEIYEGLLLKSTKTEGNP